MKRSVAFAAAILLVLGGALPRAFAQTPTATELQWLPPESVVRQVLRQLPQVREADAAIAAAEARARRLRVGPYEWQARLGIDRRNVRDEGRRYIEQEVALERTLRRPGKADADARLGDAGQRVARLARADTWHEATRALLADWTEALREARVAALLAEQAGIAEQQLRIVVARIRAGEASRMERLALQAEQARVSAAAMQARARAALSARALAIRYPGLYAPERAAALPVPAVIDASRAETVRVILDDNHELELAEAQAMLAKLQAERTVLDQQADPTVSVRATRERGGQEGVLGVFVVLPLGQAGRQADARRALAEADQAEQRQREVRRRVEADAERVAQTARDAARNWRQLESARRDTQASADLQTRAWSLGETTLADVLQARRVAQESALAAESARFDALYAQARLHLDQHRLWIQEHDDLDMPPAPPR